MIKALVTKDGHSTLMLGLSFDNLRKFLREPMDTFISIDGKAMGLPMDVLLFSGESEAHMANMMMRHIGPDTIVHVDDKLKS